MSINIQKTFHPKDISRDTEEYFIKQTMENYGTPLEVIKQKRNNINSVYYSAQKEQIFKEQMSRLTTFEITPEQALASLKTEKIIENSF
jgi:hypothetical protein